MRSMVEGASNIRDGALRGVQTSAPSTAPRSPSP